MRLERHKVITHCAHINSSFIRETSSHNYVLALLCRNTHTAVKVAYVMYIARIGGPEE